MQILAISGSLRRRSSNTAALRAAASLALPPVTIVLYDGLAGLPHFNPDIADPLPRPVAELRGCVQAADALIISSPEYARGVPGSLKNALDWLVGGIEFVDKLVALVNTSPRATHAQASLATTITTMAGRLVPSADVTLPLLAKDMDEFAIASHPTFAAELRRGIDALVRAVKEQRP